MTHYYSPLTRMGRFVFILSAVCLLLPFYSNAQNLKIGFRGGASFANFIAHNNSLASVPTSTGPRSGVFGPGVVIPPASSVYTIPAYYKTDLIKDIRTGFYAGLFLEIVLNDRWSLEPGLGYVQKGIDLEYSTQQTTQSGASRTTTVYSFHRAIHTNYISVPIVAKYTLDKKGRFYLVGGLYTAFKVRSKIANGEELNQSVTVVGDVPAISVSRYTPSDAYTKTFDAGITGGGGVSFPLSSNLAIGVDLRANVGAVNVRGKSGEQDYLSFSPNALNINAEAGVRLAYTLR